MYLLLGILFLILALIIAGIVVWTIIRTIAVDKELISKKNLFYMIPAFVLIYALYLTATYYNLSKSGAESTLAFFDYFHLISNSLEVFAFKLQTSLIRPIVGDYPIFYADFVLATVLCGATGILSIASFFSAQILNFFKLVIGLSKGCDIVLGDSASAIQYAKKNKGCFLWCEHLPRSRYFDLIKSHVAVCRLPLTSAYMARKLRKGEHHLILFRDSAYSYSNVIDTFHKIRGKEKSLLYLHLEADVEETKIIKKLFIPNQLPTHTFVSCFNKYELLARQFIKEYPISKYVPRNFFNENFTLKEDKEINVVFIGFGKVNYELFKLAAMQFQFAKMKNNALCASPVNYYMYDEEEKRLHNEYFSRFNFEFERDFADTDFPKPDKICNATHINHENINSIDARKEFCDLVTKNSFTYFIVSLSSDLEDASYAHTLERMIKGKGEYKIFVRAKNSRSEALKEKHADFIYFGEEREIFTHHCIVDDDLMTLARLNHVLYVGQTQYEGFNNVIAKIKEEPDESWNDKLKERLKDDPAFKLQMIQVWEKLSTVEQFSNIYNVLNLPFKLGLMGLSLKKKEEAGEGISFDEYCKRYRNPFMQRSCDDPDAVNRYTDYNFFFGTESSNVLAFIEHARWNAYYILSDFKQMPKQDMEATLKDGKMAHKDVEKKLHACITTHAGLDELIRYKYSAMYPDGGTGVQPDGSMDPRFQELSKLYAYDYTDLDNVYHHLLRMGYSIVENDPASM